jgi:hypothetical protein
MRLMVEVVEVVAVAVVVVVVVVVMMMMTKTCEERQSELLLRGGDAGSITHVATTHSLLPLLESSLHQMMQNSQ